MTQKPRIVATIEARMTSSRLPGKMMLTCLGKTMLEHMVGRVKRAACLDDIIIATTLNETDDVIAEEATKLNVKYFRGSEDNVMLRVLEAAQNFKADIIVELTGDCPLMDPALIDYALAQYSSSGVDYLSNLEITEFKAGLAHPLGYAVQVFSTAILADAYARTEDPLDHEHVSRYLYQTPERYRVKYLPAPILQRGPQMSVTLDTRQDFQVICRVLKALTPKNPNFTIEDVVEFLSQNPDIRRINQDAGQINTR
ncbi:MAG: glycosyltransferase family protein [Emcibacter sp.]|nr:glycosyltransferase family protein [Emcibacter sp.]